MEDQLLQEQTKPPHQQDFNIQTQLTQQHHQLLAKDEEFHLQRAKKNWALHGDRNTSFFHQSIVKRTRKNRIAYLQNPDGSDSTTHEQLSATLIAYFQDIFSNHNSTNPNATASTLNQIDAGQQVITLQDAQHINSIPDKHELHTIIKHMRNNASPGPNGLNAAFYKLAWPWLADDVYTLVRDFYTLAFFHTKINHTYIALIPKKNAIHGSSRF